MIITNTSKATDGKRNHNTSCEKGATPACAAINKFGDMAASKSSIKMMINFFIEIRM
ncbi:MAG: hypothetical protein WKF59_26375 [Chitinophagaceae bacterium]